MRNLGKPVELAARYFEEGADEVTFLNITGFRDCPLQDTPMLEVLAQASERVFVPLTVGGGIKGFTDAQGRKYSALEVAAEYFRSGADKVSVLGTWWCCHTSASRHITPSSPPLTSPLHHLCTTPPLCHVTSHHLCITITSHHVVTVCRCPSAATASRPPWSTWRVAGS